jgi:hypothetical protein
MAEDIEVEENPISRMVDYITHSEYTKANDLMNQIMTQRVSDSLDQEKIAIAQSIYSDEDEYEEYEDDDEISDEDLEDLADEYAEEEDEEED